MLQLIIIFIQAFAMYTTDPVLASPSRIDFVLMAVRQKNRNCLPHFGDQCTGCVKVVAAVGC